MQDTPAQSVQWEHHCVATSYAPWCSMGRLTATSLGGMNMAKRASSAPLRFSSSATPPGCRHPVRYAKSASWRYGYGITPAM